MPHIHEQIDFTVSALIIHDHKVLLLKHPRYGLWLHPGGHVELDEDTDQALEREIKEETGLEVDILAERPIIEGAKTKSLYSPAFVGIHEANPPHRHIDLIFIAKAKNGQHQLSDEHDEARWFAADELDNPEFGITPEIQYYAREAIKRVGEFS